MGGKIPTSTGRNPWITGTPWVFQFTHGDPKSMDFATIIPVDCGHGSSTDHSTILQHTYWRKDQRYSLERCTNTNHVLWLQITSVEDGPTATRDFFREFKRVIVRTVKPTSARPCPLHPAHRRRQRPARHFVHRTRGVSQACVYQLRRAIALREHSSEAGLMLRCNAIGLCMVHEVLQVWASAVSCPPRLRPDLEGTRCLRRLEA